MTTDDLKKVLEEHKKWIEDKNGTRAVLLKADLSNANLSVADLRNADLLNADLRYANLSNAVLSNADLSNADLSGANLSNANLRNADLSNADLSGANLSKAGLHNADLSNADLSGANLSNADLRNADLSNADLSGANLSKADLMYANLRCADLRNADLSNADLLNADLTGVKLNSYTTAFFIACPEEGNFIGYKKAAGKIVVIEIPADAKRSSATTAKCRCSKAKVLRIENLDGTPAEVTQVSSDFDENFIYKIGEIVEVSDFDENRWNECSRGIHFFLNRKNAENWGE